MNGLEKVYRSDSEQWYYKNLVLEGGKKHFDDDHEWYACVLDNEEIEYLVVPNSDPLAEVLRSWRDQISSVGTR